MRTRAKARKASPRTKAKDGGIMVALVLQLDVAEVVEKDVVTKAKAKESTKERRNPKEKMEERKARTRARQIHSSAETVENMVIGREIVPIEWFIKLSTKVDNINSKLDMGNRRRHL